MRNKIGLGADGVTALPNHATGIDLFGNTNRVGTTNPADANIIAFNDGAGVYVRRGVGHAVLGNSIFGNGGLGIDLGSFGRNENDPGDTDTGPNNLQNFPVLDSAGPSAGGLTVSGSLNSARQ